MDEDRSRNASLDESQGAKPRRPKPRDEFEGVLIGERYLLARRIGEGGFGAVYEAIDERFDSPVAVKLLFGRSDESELTFRKEAKLIRRFKHPHVVEVYDYGVDDGIAFIVMEYLSGIPLHKYSERYGRRLPTETIRKFVKEIGSALENAHAKHLVHRDLKPQNVMLVDEGQSSERFVLLDLGMATKTDAARDETIGNAMANSGLTPQYAPPEQFRQGAVTHLSDIYSFGTILYHLLSGRLPFPQAGTLGQLWHAVEHDPPPTFAEVAPDRAVAAEVEAIVRECLEKKPADRPQSMRELRERFLGAIDASRSHPTTPDWASGAVPTIAVPGDVTDPQSHPTQRPSDLLSGVRGASGSATMPVTGMLTMPESARTGPLTEPQPRRRWPAVAVAAVLMVAVVAVAVMAWPSRKTKPPLTLTGGPETWTLALGRDTTFEFPFQRHAGLDDPFVFTVDDLPEHVSAKVAPPSDNLVRFTLSAEPGAVPRDVPIVVTVSSGGQEAQAPVTLRLVWMPPEKFFEPGASDAVDGADPAPVIVTSRRTNWNFYERLNRVLEDGTRVPFRLVLDDAARDSPTAAFYVLENKVWNGIYAAFAAANPDLDPGWKESLGAGDPEPDDERWPRLPVMNVKALDALKFAKWLAGERGHLPRLEQWRTAAGFYEFDLNTGAFREDQWSEWQAGPFRGERVAVGDFADGGRLPVVSGAADPAAAGLPVDDVSPRYFVRDMAGNGAEWTSDVPPALRLTLSTSPHESVFVTGRSYQAGSPLTYADLADSENAGLMPCNMADSVTGFRVVLEPEY